MDWSFHNPVQIHAVAAVLAKLPAFLTRSGPVLIVTSPGFGRRHPALSLAKLIEGREVVVLDDVVPNPDVDHVDRQLRRVSAAGIKEIVAIGGGSVLDTAKIIAVGLERDDFSVRAHVVEGRRLAPARAARLICVPTTAGTGSEVTPFATVWDSTARKKYSVAGEAIFPDMALLDPELTLTTPEEVTLSTGLDAMTHAFEATWSRRANRISTAFATAAIRLGLDVLPGLRQRPHDRSLRNAMLEVSLLAGLAISHTRTALCHSISYPITARFGVPHGFACSFTLPEVFAFNREAEPERFQSLAEDLGLRSADGVEERLRTLMLDVDVARWMRSYVGDGSRLSELGSEMLTPGRADNNVRSAQLDDVVAIVEAACRGRGLTGSSG
jgi:alcohol dehydrogenase